MRAAALLLVAGTATAQGPSGRIQFSDLAGWEPYASRDGVVLERRRVPDSSFYEHRGVVELPVAPEAAAEAVWRSLRDGAMASLKRHDIVAESANELVVYDQIHTPVISDRDYTITVRRAQDATNRRTEIRYWTTNDRGPPNAPGFVRIPLIRAGWLIEPDGHGGTRLTNLAFSEPGGLLTAFIARGPQADRALADLRDMAEHLRRLPRTR